MLIQPNSKLLMIGDSITDCERARPVGEGLFGAIGKGYVSLVQAQLLAKYPQSRIRVVNMGCSGNTVRDLKARWRSDVVDLEPDWLSIMIGINDVWRQYDLPLQSETHVYIEEYRATLEELVKTTRPLVKGLVLCTPYYLESNNQDAMRSTMDAYGAVVADIAAQYKAYCVDTQAAFAPLLQEYHSAMLAWDRVHPNLIGHQVLAQAFLDAVEY